MNQDALLKVVKRNIKDLEKYHIRGPFYSGPTKQIVVFTDAYAAAVVPTKWVTGARAMKLEVREAAYARMVSTFEQKTADRASFQTTVGDLLAWLRSNTEACPLCGGTKLCKVPKHRDHLTAEQEDGESVHYAWIGPMAIDRRRVEELVLYMEAPLEEEIEVQAVVDYGGELTMCAGNEQVAAQGCVVIAKQWKVYCAGRNDRREAAPKFHLEAMFHHPTFTSGKRKK